MATLLLRLLGPMQSWGLQSRFGMRDTAREPSKSGVIGLVCAALGRDRADPIDDLAFLRMGVRVDREGLLEADYHTAQNIYRAQGGSPKETEVSRRYYLADGVFLVGLEGEIELLDRINRALHNPQWSLFLGRKAFIPATPIWLPEGLRRNEELVEVLKGYPCLTTYTEQDRPGRLRAVLDDPLGDQVRPDVPVSFETRRFSSRRVRTLYFPFPETTRKEA